MAEPKRRCVHCKGPVTLVNYALGPKWMHETAVRQFGDEFLYCRTAPAAEPEPLPDFIPPDPVLIPNPDDLQVWPCGIAGNRDLAHRDRACDGVHAPVPLGSSIARAGMVRIPEAAR